MGLSTVVGSLYSNQSATTLADTLFVRAPDGTAQRVIGSGGGGSFATLTDVDETGLADGQIARYSSSATKWVMVSPIPVSFALVVTSDDGSALLTDGTNPLAYQQTLHVIP